MGENYEYSASIREFTTETLSKWSLVFLCELGSSAVSFDIPPLDTRFALLGVTACPEQAAQPPYRRSATQDDEKSGRRTLI
jgi:hypothetical protein